MTDNCSTSQRPVVCRAKKLTIAAAFLFAVGIAFTAALGTGLTVLVGQ